MSRIIHAAVRRDADETARSEAVTNDHLEHEERDVEAPMGDLEDDWESKQLATELRPVSIVAAACTVTPRQASNVGRGTTSSRP